ncbi:hypothetical protein AWQ23_08370 [Picosynechococcus sp. PCC 73109]|nr:hypothetical protein AWQ23_08370 [Picosynechococcus sp. PCC 73109]
MFSCHVPNEFTALILGLFVPDVTNLKKGKGPGLNNLTKIWQVLRKNLSWGQFAPVFNPWPSDLPRLHP